MVENKVIEKIHKCLMLAKNNPNSQEAESAALMAQKLMKQHDIELSQVEDTLVKEDEIAVEKIATEGKNPWKHMLAGIIAENFRCKNFCYGKRIVCFYGKSNDAKIAKSVFEFLYKVGHNLADTTRVKYYRETGSGSGAYNSFILGYLRGIKDKFDVQRRELMIVIAEDVVNKFDEFMINSKTMKGGMKLGKRITEIYDIGYVEGNSAMDRKQLN